MYHDGVEQEDDEESQQRVGTHEVPRVARGEEEEDGRSEEESAGDDGLVDPLLVAGAERDELAEGGVVGRLKPEELSVPDVDEG